MARTSLLQVVERLHARFGKQKATKLDGPWEMILWENVAYLADDDRRQQAFQTLKSRIGECMSIKQLVALIAPPPSPLDDEGSWQAAEIVVGAQYPADFRELATGQTSRSGRSLGKVYLGLTVSLCFKAIVFFFVMAGSTPDPLAGRSLFHHQSLTVNLPVTVGMKQDEIVHRVVAAVHSPHQMVRMPAGFQQQRLTTERTLPILL